MSIELGVVPWSKHKLVILSSMFHDCLDASVGHARFEDTEFEESHPMILEFECHLDLPEDSSNNVCSKWRMKIQTEQKRPHRKCMIIA